MLDYVGLDTKIITLCVINKEIYDDIQNDHKGAVLCSTDIIHKQSVTMLVMNHDLKNKESKDKVKTLFDRLKIKKIIVTNKDRIRGRRLKSSSKKKYGINIELDDCCNIHAFKSRGVKRLMTGDRNFKRVADKLGMTVKCI
jgi:S-adenosylmethionine:tRNA-ribosyltransferase-isomerase (queuine synthetase)